MASGKAATEGRKRETEGSRLGFLGLSLNDRTIGLFLVILLDKTVTVRQSLH